jgi:hypothetical protein
MPPFSGVADLRQNGWPIWIGMGGRFTLEWVAELARNTHFTDIRDNAELSAWYSNDNRLEGKGIFE